ncbi:MAG TPA: GNAT family N-acetyltransferase [Myxococcota bacterium]|nr:GNAT family N-acetyltransferase [Myxococcota bacterium]
MEIRALRPSELEQAWELDRDAFHVPASRREAFLRIDPLRATGAFDGARLVAMTYAHGFGQFFGGRAVPMGGLASVAVVPDRRGEGLAKQVCTAALRAMRERGEAISSLYPATTSLYRALGWEVAGHYTWSKLAPAALHALPAPARRTLRPASVTELPALRACYARVAYGSPGYLERSDAWWERLASLWRERSIYVATSEDGGVDGYLVYAQQDGEYSGLGGPFRIAVRELIAATRDAGLALWRLLGGWSSQVSDLFLVGPVDDGLLLLSPQQAVQPLAQLRWMTRIVDAVGAVAARGFAGAIDVEVTLELRDATLRENDGAFVLRVHKGQGELVRAARAPAEAPRLAIGAFASLYTGFADTGRLARAGLLEGGTESALTALDAAFAGPAPTCQDEF